jgi:hypothetical protein
LATHYEGRTVLVRQLSPQYVFALWPRDDVSQVLRAYRPGQAHVQRDLVLQAERVAWLASLDPEIEIEVVVLHARSETPLGLMCLSAIDAVNGKAEFSAGFFRGCGSRPAAEASHWALETVFSVMGLRKLIFHVLPGNAKAHTLLKAAGIGQEALLRGEIILDGDQTCDLFRYALFRDEWLAGSMRARLQRAAPLALG